LILSLSFSFFLSFFLFLSFSLSLSLFPLFLRPFSQGREGHEQKQQ